METQRIFAEENMSDWISRCSGKGANLPSSSFPSMQQSASEKPVPNQKYVFALCHCHAGTRAGRESRMEFRGLVCLWFNGVKRGGRGRKWSQHPKSLGNPGNSGLADQRVPFRRGKWSLGKVYQRSNLLTGITKHTHTLWSIEGEATYRLGGAWLDRQSLIWP